MTTFYLSSDSIYDSSDVYAGEFYRSSNTPLSVGESYTQTRNITIPGTTIGSQYLIFVSDRSNYQGETDETNNTYAVPITITAPDLVITNATAPTAAILQEKIRVSFTVKNQGDVPTTVRSRYDEIFLSDDTTLDNSDTAVSSDNYWNYYYSSQTLAPGESYIQTRDITIPNVSLGNKYLLFVADRWNYQRETDETNNTYALPITLSAPDLIVTGLNAPSLATIQDSIEVSWTVKNQGNVSAPGNWYDYFYLSTDAIYNESDTYAGSFSRGSNTPLDASESYTQTQNLKIPKTVSGSQYLIVVTNRDRTKGKQTPPITFMLFPLP
ncbi:MAG: hypothetical protein HC820_01615 [Hydrococcus sp. RM1_1_31]|nr:hypothetical protein [Hydrococcus sp. RM1_1_31]